MGSPTTPRPTTGQKQDVGDASTGSPSEPLGWWSLTPSLSIAVFLIVAMFTLDSSGSSRIGLALIAGVLIGPLASYLFDAYWPRISTGDRPAPRAPSPGAKP
jgi:hypothetical protein